MEDFFNSELESTAGTVEGAASAGTAEPGASVAGAVAERDRLQAERDELWDRLVRKQAEFENFRRRTTREKEDVLQFAAMETVRALLPVLDDFERAMQAPAGGDDYRRGIELIYKRLYDSLVRMGLSPIDTRGQKFDPNYHQAVDTLKTEELEDQSIVEEYQRGYEFKGRLLRPAMVKVAVRE
jgi:molecular chaperone GrpE